MNYKETVKKIEEMLQGGLSREAVFSNLERTDDMARMVVSVPLFEDRKKYHKTNILLFLILIYVAVVKALITIINIISMNLSLIILPFAFFWPVVVAYFAFNIKKYRGFSYGAAGWVCIVIFCQSGNALLKSQLVTSQLALWGILNGPLLFGTYLSFYLKKKLCPYLGFWGAKTDNQGKYIFKDSG